MLGFYVLTVNFSLAWQTFPHLSRKEDNEPKGSSLHFSHPGFAQGKIYY